MKYDHNKTIDLRKMIYTTEQFETFTGEDGKLKQIKITKTWQDNELIETVVHEQTQQEIEEYFISIQEQE